MRKSITPCMTAAYEVAHQRRQVIINCAFPALRTTIGGKTWAGALITHDDDALFLRGERQFRRCAWAQEVEPEL